MGYIPGRFLKALGFKIPFQLADCSITYVMYHSHTSYVVRYLSCSASLSTAWYTAHNMSKITQIPPTHVAGNGRDAHSVYTERHSEAKATSQCQQVPQKKRVGVLLKYATQHKGSFGSTVILWRSLSDTTLLRERLPPHFRH